MRNFGELGDADYEGWFRQQTPLGLFAKLVGTVMVLSLVFGVLGWIGGWWSEAKRVTGVENVTTQYQVVIDDWESLISEAENACGASKVSVNGDSPTFVEDPALAYEAKFRSTRTDYNRRMQNIFEARLVGPRGYPRTVPALPTNWCDAADQLSLIHP